MKVGALVGAVGNTLGTRLGKVDGKGTQSEILLDPVDNVVNPVGQSTQKLFPLFSAY
jgi:hypothetical protein